MTEEYPPTDDTLKVSISFGIYPLNTRATGISGSINFTMRQETEIAFKDLGSYIDNVKAALADIAETYKV